MLRGYDAWKTTPPEKKHIHAVDCHHCETEIFVGENALRDCVTGEYFCNTECVKKYIKENLNEFMAEIVDRNFSLVELEGEDIA